MEITNLPLELQIELLLDLTPEQLLSYCRITSSVYKMCTSYDFIHQYVLRKYGLNINMMPYDKPWQAFIKINSLIDRSRELEVEEEDAPWDPWDNPDDPRYRINPEVGDLVRDAVATGYPRLVKIILNNLFSDLYWNYNIGDIFWLQKAFDLVDTLNIEQNTMIELKNLLLLYYTPSDLIDQIIEQSSNLNDIYPYFDLYPEMVWLVLHKLGREGEATHPELAKYLWDRLPLTQRYNRSDPIPFYEDQIMTVRRYASNRVDLIQRYTDELDRVKRYIRADLQST